MRRPTPRRMLVVLAVLCVLGVAGLAASVVAVGLWLAAPARAVVGAPPAEIATAESVQIQSASGALLRGWFLPGRPGGGAVVLMHGVRANRSMMVRRAAMLNRQGFAALLFDFQSHGESAGDRITFGKREALDAAAAVACVRGRLPGERIGAIGVSLGGAAALVGATPLPVDALVLESVFPDIDAALANRLRFALGPVIGPIFTPLLTRSFELLLPPILGVGLADLRPIDRIAEVAVPVLVISGDADRSTPMAETEAIYAQARQPKRLEAVAGAGHVDLEAYDPGGYWDVVMPFLVEYLQTDDLPHGAKDHE